MFETILQTEAKFNITWGGQNADLAQPVPFDAPEADLKQWATEAVANGNVPGLPAAQADFTDFVVDRYSPTAGRPFNLIMLRPKTPFGLFELLQGKGK